MIPTMATIAWSGRNVHIVFDYDAKPETRRKVDAARKRLARALRKAGAKEVYAVEIPPGPDGAKQGVDDFLVAHGLEAFQVLVARPSRFRSSPLTNLSRRPRGGPTRTTLLGSWRNTETQSDGSAPGISPPSWDGSRWKLDQSLAVVLRAKDIAAGLFHEIGTALREKTQ